MLSLPSVAVVGGSLGGLTAALVLRDLGCDVTVYERSTSALQARGVGIAVLPETLRYPLDRLGLKPAQISSSTEWIRFISADNRIEHEQKHPYRFSSWNTIYRTLLGAIAPERYVLGREMVSFANDASGVTVDFGDGKRTRVELLVCADGINSTARATLLPEVVPRYAGYIAWRGVIAESELSLPTLDALHDALTYQILPNSHILVYPIPGWDGAVEPGRRLMNMVWYRNVAEQELPVLLTDRDGVQRAGSLPPGTVRSDVVASMREFAQAHLAAPIAEVLTRVSEPFIQAVFDIDVPRMVVGRTCLIGDAAFAVRPHAAAGTAKAAEDGWSLAQEIANSDGDVEIALRKWQVRQLALGRALLRRNREIGDSSQFTAGFRAGDPRLIFGLHAPGR